MPRQTKVILRNGTYAEWVAANPVLADREVVFENDSNLIKVGDGIKNYLDHIYDTSFGVTSWSPDYAGLLPQYPSNYSTTTAAAPTALSYSTTSRAMHLVPFSYYENSFNFPALWVSQGGSGLAGKCAFYLYNSDEYGRPYQLVSSNGSDGNVDVSGTPFILNSFAGAGNITVYGPSFNAPMTSSSTYWIGVCGYNITTAGSILTYTGNDTYINPTTSSGTIASTLHYNCYIVNLPYSATSMNYTIQNGSKVFTIANTTFAGTNLSLSGSYAVHGGLAVGDLVYVYADSNPLENQAEGTISALTTTSITINFTGNTNWSGLLTANTKNIIMKSSDFGSYNPPWDFTIPPIVPYTLTTSHLMPSTGNAPIVRVSG